MLLGQHRHAEHQRVHADEHLTAGAEHARDLGYHVLGRQPERERPVLGDHAVGAAVGQELEPGAVGGHGGQAQPGSGVRAAGVDGVGRLWRQGGRVDDAKHVMPGVGCQLGRARARAGNVDEEL